MRTPSPALAEFVESLWWFTGELAHARERIVPDGAMGLLVNLDEDELRSYHGDELASVERVTGAALCGAWGHSFGIDTAEQRCIAGVSFKPGGAAPFFHAPASETAEQHVALEALWGRGARSVRERLLEAESPEAALETLESLLLSHLARPLAPDPALRFAVAALERGAAVGAVQERLGLAPKRFIARFRNGVGLTPKRFARVRRFQRVLESLPPDGRVDWCDVAARCGYFDQAHLIRDFRELAGMTPTEYRPHAPDRRDHVAV